jgi:hypothetical protein
VPGRYETETAGWPNHIRDGIKRGAARQRSFDLEDGFDV